MCFAIPGKVVEIDGKEAVVDYGTEKRMVSSFLPVKIGDYVVVSGKVVIEKVEKEDALKAIKLFSELK